VEQGGPPARALQFDAGMHEIVHEFAAPLLKNGARYRVEAWGRPRPDGLWDGWLAFVPLEAGEVRVTGRETSQSTLAALAYWARGLGPVYLEGAFDRAVAPSVAVAPPVAVGDPAAPVVHEPGRSASRPEKSSAAAPESPALLEADGTQPAA
jgi:hypothetical protein